MSSGAPLASLTVPGGGASESGDTRLSAPEPSETPSPSSAALSSTESPPRPRTASSVQVATIGQWLLLLGVIVAVMLMLFPPARLVPPSANSGINHYNCVNNQCVLIAPGETGTYTDLTACSQECTEPQYVCETQSVQGNGFVVTYNTGTCVGVNTTSPGPVDGSLCDPSCTDTETFFCNQNLGCVSPSRNVAYPGQLSYVLNPPADVAGAQQCATACQQYHYCGSDGRCHEMGYFDNPSSTQPPTDQDGLPVPTCAVLLPGTCPPNGQCTAPLPSGTCCTAADLGSPCGGACCPAGQSCVNGTCTSAGPPVPPNCGTGRAACGSVCCAPGQTCSGGQCVAACSATQTACGATCCDNETQVCQSGACVSRCPQGQIACGGACCASGQSCVNGACVCPENQVACGPLCCQQGQTCINGQCVESCDPPCDKCSNCVDGTCRPSQVCDSCEVCDPATGKCTPVGNANGTCSSDGCQTWGSTNSNPPNAPGGTGQCADSYCTWENVGLDGDRNWNQHLVCWCPTVVNSDIYSPVLCPCATQGAAFQQQFCGCYDCPNCPSGSTGLCDNNGGIPPA